MKPHALSPRPSGVAPFLLLAVFLAVCVVGAASGTGQSEQKEEREIKDEIPAHLPIKIKVKNAEKVKDLKNDGWMRDLELEVKNTGTKPIYYLRVSLFFVDVEFSSGERYGFPLAYGRPELLDFAERITPEDVPLLPGETHIFRISESLVKGWNHHKAKSNKPQPKKIGVDFHVLNFGDGTGFVTTGGLPVPNLPKKSSVKGGAGDAATSTRGGWQRRPLKSTFQLASFLPADISPVNFYPATKEYAAGEVATPQTCCPGTPCEKLRMVTGGNCFCPDQPPAVQVVSDHSCINPAAVCGSMVTEATTCGEGETFHTCTNFFVRPCGSTPPMPTPTPMPTPEPTETPEPTPINRCTCRPNPSCDCIPHADAGGPTIFNYVCPNCGTGSEPANYCEPTFINGCPPGKFNNGSDCCVCNTPTGDCPTPAPTPPGPECPPASVVPCPTDLPPPDPDAGPTSPPAQCCDYSPILIDIDGDGFALTSASAGVLFDFNGDGLRSRFSWTATGSDDAWLALDRDGDGRVGDAAELFGNATAQPAPPPGERRNGFLALAVFDKSASGGNGDGVIDRRDAVFASLRLWRDANHDGVSQPAELFTLAALDVVRLHLGYKESKRVDEHGNRFRYRAKADDARGAKAGRWAWDVFLVSGQ